MRIILSLIIGLCQLFNSGCTGSEPGATLANVETIPGYEITIRIVDEGNPFDKVMNVFSGNGLSVVNIHHIFFSGERQEIRVTVRNGDRKLITESEQQLRSVLNVESVSVRKI